MGVPGFCSAVIVPVAEGLGAADVAVVVGVECQHGSYHCHCIAGDAKCLVGARVANRSLKFSSLTRMRLSFLVLL